MIGKGNPREYERALSELSLRDPVRRASAAATVGVFGSDEDVPRLKPLVSDESEAVRVAALYALALLGEKSAVEKLFPFVGHAREQYRKLALTALEGATRLNHGKKLPLQFSHPGFHVCILFLFNTLSRTYTKIECIHQPAPLRTKRGGCGGEVNLK